MTEHTPHSELLADARRQLDAGWSIGSETGKVYMRLALELEEQLETLRVVLETAYHYYPKDTPMSESMRDALNPANGRGMSERDQSRDVPGATQTPEKGRKPGLETRTLAPQADSRSEMLRQAGDYIAQWKGEKDGEQSPAISPPDDGLTPIETDWALKKDSAPASRSSE